MSDEYRMDMLMCKFPGGGLEYGEGTLDCLKREFKEELNIEIEIARHFYTTDYFQPALFFENTQLISIYYLVTSANWPTIRTTKKTFDIKKVDGEQSFRWVNINELNAEELTFPIDKKVAKMLTNPTMLLPQ